MHTFLLAQTPLQRVATSWQWYIIRGAGFTAAGLLVLMMLSGIGQVTGVTYRFIEPLKAWAIHKAMAYALLASIAVHVTFLLFDHFAPFSLIQVLVPFASSYTNGTTLLGIGYGLFAVAFGILSMYIVILIVATSLGWIESKKRLWRLTHYLSYLAMLFVILHALGTGTDVRYGSFRAAWITLAAIVALAVLARLWRAGTLRRKKPE